MTTINVNYSVSSAYTWNGYPDTWDDPESSKTWDTAGVLSWTLDVDEPISYAEAGLRSPTKNAAETLSLVDARQPFAIFKNAAETLNIASTNTLDSAWTRTFGETLALTEAGYRTVVKNVAETINIAEAISKNFAKNLTETIQYTEVYSRQINWFRTFAETIVIVDVRYTGYALTRAETLGLHDNMVRRGDQVHTDLIVREDAMTFEEFQAFIERDAPITYADFVPFIPGDYNLTKAAIRITMTRENLSQDLRLTKGSIFMDVPDVNDRGRVTITQTLTATHVTFNRRFIDPPEVSPGQVSSTQFAVARVSNITTTGFDLELVNASNARVTGTVSWNALGIGG